jgi:SHOCT-like domain
MGENQKKILQMLAEGKITVDEASRLLSAIWPEREEGERIVTDKAGKPEPKYLYVRVEPKEGHEHKERWGHGPGFHGEYGRVNVRVPVSLVRAGMKLTALMPPHVADDVNRALKEKGIGFDIRSIKDEYVEQLIVALGDTEINVDSDEATVRVYAE